MYADVSQFADLQRKHTPVGEIYVQASESDHIVEQPTALQSVLVHATDPFDTSSSVTSPLIDQGQLPDDAAAQHARCTFWPKPCIGLSLTHVICTNSGSIPCPPVLCRIGTDRRFAPGSSRIVPTTAFRCSNVCNCCIPQLVVTWINGCLKTSSNLQCNEIGGAAVLSMVAGR